jgi:ADP-ribose pyrophosphatase
MQKEVYKGKIIRVTEEEINGTIWERSYLPDGVIVFPIDNEGRILLVNEKRPHESPPERIKPLSGIIERDMGSDEENAQREMQEEIGFKAGRLERLWTQRASGTVNNEQHYFIAWDLIPSKLPNPDGEDTIMSVIAYTPKELLELILRDEIRWSMSTLGLFRLLKRLGALS